MMTWQAWLTLVVTILVIAALVKDWLAPSAAMFGAAVLLMIVGILTPGEAFSGFSNTAPITVAALYIVARAVEKTGGLQPIVAAALGAGKNTRASLARLLIPASAASAFLNNTPIVSMLIGPVTEWADRNGKSPSRYLMPLAFGVTFGGMMTAIGTSTNLVVSGLLEQRGEAPFNLFELTPLGLPIAIGGLLLMIVLAPMVLPERRAPRESLDENVREFAIQLVVQSNGPLEGKAVDAGGLRHLQGVYLVQIRRDEEIIAPVDPATVLQGGDRLTFVGRADLVLDLQLIRGLDSAAREHMDAFDTEKHTFFEVVLGESSPLVGSTLKKSNFRATYQAAVVAIHRSGKRVDEKLGEVELQVGDTLVLLSDAGFRNRWRDRNDFLVVSRIGGTTPGVTKKAPIVWGITLLIVFVAGLGLMPILEASLLGAFAMVLFRVLTPGEARASVDLDVIVLIAAAFGLGAAIEKTGLAQLTAEGLVGAFGWLGPSGALLGLVLATVLLTEIITNNAAAVIVFPIAIATAAQAGGDARGYAIAITIAASAGFMTPIGYQTNLMVYGPGGYRFTDYARLGFPLSVMTIAAIVLLVPLIW